MDRPAQMTAPWSSLPPDELTWAGIDFDKTICDNSGYPDYTPGQPLPGAVDALREMEKKGLKITIFTARPWADYKNIEDYCSHYGIPARRIICGKPLLKFLVDDKNIEFHGDWNEVMKKI